MEIFKDLIGFLHTLSLIDLVFFFSVVVLIILVVSLIYFIKINEDDFEKKKEEPKIPIEINEIKNPEISNIHDENEEGELLDLAAISKAIEENKSSNIDLTAYEMEQEQRAIISYDELLKKTNNVNINYTEEENIDNLTVKKVNLDNLISSVNMPEPKIEVRVISYAKEEAFLEALKSLQEKLN